LPLQDSAKPHYYKIIYKIFNVFSTNKYNFDPFPYSLKSIGYHQCPQEKIWLIILLKILTKYQQELQIINKKFKISEKNVTSFVKRKCQFLKTTYKINFYNNLII